MGNKRRLLIIAAVIAIAAAAFCFGMMSRPKPPAERTGDASAYLDPNADGWDVDVSEEAAKTAKEKDQILVPGYSWAEMNAGDTTLSMSIGNPKENSCYLKASLIVVGEDGTEKTLYESGLLEPAKGVKEVTLGESLPAGTYDAMVRFQAYTLDEKRSELNSVDSGFKLIVV